MKQQMRALSAQFEVFYNLERSPFQGVHVLPLIPFKSLNKGWTSKMGCVMSSLEYILSWKSSTIFSKHERIDDDGHKALLISWKLEP